MLKLIMVACVLIGLTACSTVERAPLPKDDAFAEQPTPAIGTIELVLLDARGTPLNSNTQRCDIAVQVEGTKEWVRVFGPYEQIDELALTAQQRQNIQRISNKKGQVRVAVQFVISIGPTAFQETRTYRLQRLTATSEHTWYVGIKLPVRCRQVLRGRPNVYDQFHRNGGEWPHEKTKDQPNRTGSGGGVTYTPPAPWQPPAPWAPPQPWQKPPPVNIQGDWEPPKPLTRDDLLG